MMTNLIEMENTYIKEQQSLQESIAKARSDLTDKYDPNLPGPAMTVAKEIEKKSPSNVMGKLCRSRFEV